MKIFKLAIEAVSLWESPWKSGAPQVDFKL